MRHSAQSFRIDRHESPRTVRHLLTYNRQDHHHKVKYIPTDGEVIVTQRDHLQHALPGEEHDEDQVDPVEGVVHI